MVGSAVEPSWSLASWTRCWTGLGATREGSAVHAALLDAYREPQRRYHTLQHLGECLALFESARALASHPAEVEAALWFHDAFYDVHSSTNEAQSAEWARTALVDGGAPQAAAERVHTLVMATQHHAAPSDADGQLLVDIDLSILAAEPARFDEYERQIREEYAFVPEPVFHDKRRQILRGFLSRDRIFATGHFHAELEARARENLTRAAG